MWHLVWLCIATLFSTLNVDSIGAAAPERVVWLLLCYQPLPMYVQQIFQVTTNGNGNGNGNGESCSNHDRAKY